MRYLFPLMMALGVLSHALVVHEMPPTRSLPLPQRLLLAVLPTALLLAPPLFHRGISARAMAGLALVTGGLYLWCSLLLPMVMLMMSVLGSERFVSILVPLLLMLLLQLPALVVALRVLGKALDDWRASGRPKAAP